MIETALIAHLNRTPEVTELVGDRIGTLHAAQHEAYPRVRLQRIATARARCLDGPLGLPMAVVQIDCLARTDLGARTLADRVRRANGGQAGKSLERFRGTMGDYAVQSCRVADERDIPMEPTDGSEKPVYGVSLDVEIWFEEPT